MVHKHGSQEGEVDPFDDFSKLGKIEGRLLDSVTMKDGYHILFQIPRS